MKETKDEIRVFEGEAGIRAGFTTRSTTAAARRDELLEEVAPLGGSVIHPCLVHGTDIVLLEEDCPKGLVDIEDTDGCITDVPHIVLTSTHGDCLPIYAYDPVHRAIGLVHAGWRGTQALIAENLVACMEQCFGTDPGDLKVCIGPGIDSCCFEVDEDVAMQFLGMDWADEWIGEYVNLLPSGKYTIDLKGFNLELLMLNGVEDISLSPLCTCCREDLFYSWRRSRDKDRMLAYIEIL